MSLEHVQVAAPQLASQAQGCFFVFFVWLSAQVVPYNQRISLLLYKMREAVNALGNQQHALALGYAASTMHDVAALHK